jgi:hypothetical protein
MGDRNGRYHWIAGSPQAAENPPKDAVWRREIARELRGYKPQIRELSLDFELEPRRLRVDLDNLARLAVSGLRDAGVITRGTDDIRSIVMTKRPGSKVGLGVGFVWTEDEVVPEPFPNGPDLDVAADLLPSEDSIAQKLAWRDAIAAAWPQLPVDGFVGVEITTTRRVSLVGLLKPVIDGLEPYLGREPLGAGRLRPRDERVVWLKVSRAADGPVLRVRAGAAPPLAAGRTRLSYPFLPPTDTDAPMGGDEDDALELVYVWGKVWEPEKWRHLEEPWD